MIMRQVRLLGLCLPFAISFCASAQDLTELEEQALRAAVVRVAPSVVRIETIGGLEQVNHTLLGEGPTTGLIVSTDGYIVSSAFNFLGQPASILVTLPGGQRVPARIIARDDSRKVVLLKVTTADTLPITEPATRDTVRVGQWAIALGRAFPSEQASMSIGIVSAKNRIWGKALQTDAKISPGNYGGPLIDVQGRVLGVLVPLSPQGHDETAGAEWYDGGIGFAVPLADLLTRLDRMKKGENLRPGLLGVTLKPGDMFSLPVELAACHPKSPAHAAGVRAGDVIVECNGVRVARQAQFKHVIGPLYAGDTVKLVTTRGTERRETSVELVAELQPYEHPFLGILPAREADGAARGVGIRFIYPGSGAQQAGLKVGDRIVQLADKDIADAAALRNGVATFEPKQKVALQILRAGQSSRLEIELGRLPNELPPVALTPAPAADLKPGELVDVKLPEEPNACVAYVPSVAGRSAPLGLIVALPAPGEFQRDLFEKRWRPIADRFGLIALAPQPSQPNTWLPTEVDVIRKLTEQVAAKYGVDRTRIAVSGYQASGVMAFVCAFRHRELFRGIVAVDAGIPGRMQPPDNNPMERLAIMAVVAEKSATKKRIATALENLRTAMYPVTTLDQLGDARDLNHDEWVTIARWLDALDRL